MIVSITTPIAKDTLPPSKPQQLKAIKVGADSVTLSWQASEDNIGVVGYEIERDGEKIADSKTPGFTDNKLEPLKSYSYKVIAYDAAGNRSGQAVVSITTVAIPDTQAPTVPKNLKAEADQDAKVIRLSWDAAGDNVAVLGYQIIRNGKELTKTDSTGYADHDVEAGKSYNYQVEAFDAAGNNSGAGDAVSAKIDQPPAIAPVTGATLAATCAGCHGSDGQSEGDAIPTLAGMDKSYFSGVMASYQNGKRYSTMMGRIAGAYSEDEISKMGDYFARQNFTPAKQSINLSRAQQGQKLHGNNSCNSCHGSDGKDNGNGTLAGQWMPYMIATLDDYAERRSSDGAKSMRDKLKQMSAADRLALAHYYASHGSDTQAPDAPADLAIAAKTETSLTLSWTDADDDSRVARYEIHRDGVKIGETELNSYTDTGLKAATVYSYDVYAVDAVGNRSIDAADVTGKTRGEPEVVDPDVDRGHNLWTANGCTTCHQSPEVFTDKLEKKYGKDVDVAKVLTTAIKTNLGGMGVFSGLSEQDIKDMDAYVNSETGGTSPGDPSSIEGVNLMSNAQTVRKAAILLAGRLPTEQELKQAKDEAGLHKAVKGLMKGEKFAEFIYNTANEWFLTAGAVPGAPKILTGTFGGFGAQGADGVTRLADMRREPLEMARFIVENDRSWEEMLTADYSVVSRTNLSKVYKGRAVNLGGAVKAGWTPGRYGYAAEGFKGGPNTRPFWATSHLKEPYPHAGVLSSLSWLARFPTNGTNRNRHRTRILYRTFLGVDIEALAERPTDSTDLGDYPIPVMQNPNCTVCHTSMDPAAGAFMDFGEKMPYRSEGVDSLDGLYKGRSYPRHPDTGKQWYQNGDHWYRDVFAPGYEGKKMPGGVYGFKGRDPSTGKVPNAENDNGAKNAMAWMARELVKDPRFAVGAVRFWYRGLFGREALWAPQDNTAPAYAANLAAFQVENKIIDQLAKDFRKGGHKVRDLLAGLVLSDLFRAGTTDLNLGKAKLATLSRTGMGRLLRYQELNNKAEALVGKPVFNDSASDIMTFIYSGFDGGALTSERNAELTPVMAAAYEQRLNAVLCDEHLVNSDFKLPAAQRKFFPYVELYHQAKGSKPDPKSDGKDVSHIRRNIQHLHAHLLGEELPLDDAEIDRTFALFSEVQAMGFDDSGLRYNQGPAFTCEGQTNKIEHTRKGTLYLIDRRKAIADPYGTHRAWNAVLSYLLGDVRMLND
ncbi:MAG: fibronectin type III domain-containing protein [Candidatus Sedimenticola sp. PURPLELP]